MSGIYLHIPFCKSRCVYCGFYSTTGVTAHTEQAYVNALCRELQLRQDYLPSSEYVNTIYFGGGTPSVLSAESLHTVVHTIKDVYGAMLRLREFTMECNPDDVTPQLASTLVELGVNRISMGVQSFNPQILSFLHRRHNASQVAQAVETFRAAGITNISLDLIYGIPGQTQDMWLSDIRQTIALSVPHISSYALSYEDDTPLTRLLNKGEITPQSDEEYLQMYLTLVDALSDVGYEHYEISNFSLPGHRSLHNSSYWNGTPYLGVGAGAHSYRGITATPSGFGTTSRQWNICDIGQYTSAYVASSSEADRSAERQSAIEQVVTCETLDDDEQYNDIIVTQLRREEGIDLSCLPHRYRAHLLRAAQKSIDNGTLALSPTHIHLTRKGLFISDAIMTELII